MNNASWEEEWNRTWDAVVAENKLQMLHKRVEKIEAYLTQPAEPTQPAPLDWLPKHKAALYITHNDHKGGYESVEEHYDYLSSFEWVSPEEKQRAIELDSVWELHWYPDTPIGSYKVAASSLEAIQKHMMEHGDAYR